MFCENCGKQIPDGVPFCGECGAKIEETKEVKVDPEYCEECGALIADGSGICPACGYKCKVEAVAAEAPKKISTFFKTLKEKFLRKKIIVPVAIVAAVAIVASIAYPYVKNALAKLFLNEEQYFAYVVSDNVDDISDTIANRLASVKKTYTKGSGAKSEINLEVKKGMTALLEDIGAEDAEEYITWLKKASIKMDGSYKDSKAHMNYDVKVNGKDMGEFDLIYDMSDMSYYIGAPDYNSEYIHVENYYGDMAGSGYEAMNKIAEALPKEAKTEKIIKRYVKTFASSVENVEESTEEIEAEGVSQNVTVLSFDINGELMKNASLNVLNELKDDEEVKQIVGDVLDAAEAGVDVDELWNELDDAIENLEDEDPEDIGTVAKFELYVDAKGDIVGFKISNEEFTFASYSAVKGGKYGSVTEISYYNDVTVKIVGSGKAFGNKRTGEYALKVNGISALEFSIKNVDTKLLEKGIFKGSITFEVPEGIITMLSYATGMDIDRDLAKVLSNLSITINSKTRKLEKSNYELVVKYDNEECLKLSAKGSEKRAKKVKEPKKYIDANDYDELEEWASEFKFDALTKKLQKAKFPDEAIEAVEEVENNL